ncbi:hypothetical protein EIL50_04120 [bacterium NHP-B]|nr:hypothetical protein EIL50_04120 [bacterium NHP-B]
MKSLGEETDCRCAPHDRDASPHIIATPIRVQETLRPQVNRTHIHQVWMPSRGRMRLYDDAFQVFVL